MGLGSIMGFEDMRPQVYAIVEVDHDVFVQGEIINIPYNYREEQLIRPSAQQMTEELQGRPVEVVVRRLRKMDNGYPTYGYKFKLADTGTRPLA